MERIEIAKRSAEERAAYVDGFLAGLKAAPTKRLSCVVQIHAHSL